VSVTAEDIYRWLLSGGEGSLCGAFEKHVVASILSLALTESSLVVGTGLTPVELKELAQLCFPHAEPVFSRVDVQERPVRAADETCLQELLFRGSSERSRLEHFLSCMIARRAQRPNHLWQDLGLRRRQELSWLMQQHFEPLATRNKQNMKWKKFLYRLICRDEGFALCTAPTCEECDDVESCFGDEAGESLVTPNEQTSGGAHG
jgi:nitrogen fixation protein NifQ